MTVLVTGARGVLGHLVVAELTRRGYDVRTAGRSGANVAVDLESGAGIDRAVAGVEAAIHCATDRRRHRQVDVGGTRRLLDHLAARVILPSMVGCDVIPLGYCASKLAAEDAVLRHPAGGVVARATQFNHSVWEMLSRLARPPVMVVPNDTRAQPLDPASLAIRLVDALQRNDNGRLEDLGGRYVYEARDLARSYLAATGRRRPVVRLNFPGLTGASFRAGGNLTPNRDEAGETWNDFVARRTGDRSPSASG